jgi:hypothetical protein
VTKVVSPDWNSTTASPTTATTTAKLDRWGNVIEQFDARGYQTRNYYNDQNKLVRQLAPSVFVLAANGTGSMQNPETRWLYDKPRSILMSRDRHPTQRAHHKNTRHL